MAGEQILVSTPELAPRNDTALRKGPDASHVPVPSGLFKRVTYGRDLWLCGSTKFDDKSIAVGSFSSLHRVNLVHLQNELALIKTEMSEHETVSEEQIQKLQRKWLPYEISTSGCMIHLESCNHLDTYPNDTTYLNIERNTEKEVGALREFLRKWLPRQLSWSLEARWERPYEYHLGEYPAYYSRFVEGVPKFLFAPAAGCSFVVPMTIMVKGGASQKKSLTTVSVAVTIFAMILTIGAKLENKDALAVTAAYAAVLVVFVGSSVGQRSQHHSFHM
ncbi:uncharacterized protein A1O5_01862 [Cladophialophora psammophila CBS 110553]|uniref:DUF6594 domain-containing protein n=1 Tax=Cladophialophora psammophila CBS 110553 TaxID=1182543 RepID=W9XDW9_9EURO|nr:uncharacterized protein A1O5_01862 [Cladophialophora psammophila CBS 110553]EXJ75166.1 hypothetical protein A1O5_01862 [Cladophialophora psammophila CBS 110553]